MKKTKTIKIPVELYEDFINFLSLSLSRLEDRALQTGGVESFSRKEKRVIKHIQNLVVKIS